MTNHRVANGARLEEGKFMARVRPISGACGLLLAVALLVTACKPSSDDVNTKPDPTGSKTTSGKSSSTKPSSQAKLGQPITIKGNDDGSSLQVTALAYKSTVKATDGISSPDAGKRYVAVQFRLKNVGTAAYDDAPSNGAEVSDASGQQFDADITTDTTAGPGLPSQVKLPSGGVALGYLIFQVPTTDKVAKVQFSMDSGFGQTAEWVIS